MKGFGLQVTLVEDCVLSERGATEGGHRGLDYLPGASLLGFAASKLYERLGAEDAFTVFHSGRVRFSNGLPVSSSGEPCWPLPLCWHHEKGESPAQGGQVVPKQVRWLDPREAATSGAKMVQMRGGYVSASGALVEPAKALRLKTAIDPATSRARQGALFGYEAIRAGARFHSRIEADDDVPAVLIDRLRETFSQQLSLGRSRSAEYGRATATVVDLPADSRSTPTPASTTLTLWLLSDLQAIDDHGQATVAPKPQWLGLPEGELVRNRSFLRARRYSPWNAKRGGPDLERQVIAQGSVLTFDLSRPIGPQELARIQGGLGLHREAGLGQVWLDPPLLHGDVPELATLPRAVSDPAPGPRPDSPLIDWLQQQVEDSDSAQNLANRARREAQAYQLVIASARRLRGLDAAADVGPSHSQWGSVLATAKSSRGALAHDLFDPTSGLCREVAPGWSEEYWDEKHARPRRFTNWLRQAIGERAEPRFVQLLAREVMAVLKADQRR